jgi:hypothetical protein
MTDVEQDQERDHRDRGRSEEARWQVAEAAAENEERRLSETARQSGGRRDGKARREGPLTGPQ